MNIQALTAGVRVQTLPLKASMIPQFDYASDEIVRDVTPLCRVTTKEGEHVLFQKGDSIYRRSSSLYAKANEVPKVIL